MIGAGMAIFEGWRPGVIGDVVAAHAVYYAREWGFGPRFEAKVAWEMAEFIDRYAPERDRLLTASSSAGFLGGVVIDGTDPKLAQGQAHLRWFIATDAARGTGVGGALLAEALAFLGAAGFSACYLTTFAGLTAARRLYERHGFRLMAEAPGSAWGVEVMEQRFELSL